MTGPFFAERSDAMLQLEAMVDKVGIANVLHALEHICNGKAEHLATNWQDNGAAKNWERRAREFSKLAGNPYMRDA